jgi:predicted HicB family RNase H-like nuclease
MKGRPKLYSENRETTNLVFPKSVKEAAVKAANSQRLSLSQWVVRLIEEKLDEKKKF